ncbi:hypothetical protein [Rhizobium sp. LjRoot254]|uniref:hypothetical protein n=1 Tax=Rhizobium sp. LjRoot254 TaxID=3342297 RepID=UPI003ECFEF95
MKFRPTEPITKSQFQSILNNGDSVAIAHAIIDAANHIHDYQWLMDQVRYLLETGDDVVVNCSLLALADIARLEKQATRDDLLRLLKIVEEDARYCEYVENVRDDIDMFLPEHVEH